MVSCVSVTSPCLESGLSPLWLSLYQPKQRIDQTLSRSVMGRKTRHEVDLDKPKTFIDSLIVRKTYTEHLESGLTATKTPQVIMSKFIWDSDLTWTCQS